MPRRRRCPRPTGLLVSCAAVRRFEREEERRPSSSAASAQMRPPCFWTTRCTVASPMPVPSKSVWRCRRWKAPKSLSRRPCRIRRRCRARRTRRRPRCAGRTRSGRVRRLAVNFQALPSRFSSDRRTRRRSASARMSGASPIRRPAPDPFPGGQSRDRARDELGHVDGLAPHSPRAMPREREQDRRSARAMRLAAARTRPR